MNKKCKEAYFNSIGGRAGVSERVLEIAKQIVDTKSYKRAIIGAGQIRALAEISEVENYWDEKMSYGYETEKRILTGCRKVTFNADGYMQGDEELQPANTEGGDGK